MDIQTRFVKDNMLLLYNQKGNIIRIIFQNQSITKCDYKIDKIYEF